MSFPTQSEQSQFGKTHENFCIRFCEQVEKNSAPDAVASPQYAGTVNKVFTQMVDETRWKKFCNFLKKKSELDGGELLGRFSSNWFTASAQVDNAHLHTLRMFSLIFDLMNGNALRAASLIWLHSTLISQLRSFDDSALSCTCASISDRFLTGGVISKRWIDVAAEVMKRLVDIGNPCFVIAGKQLDGCEYRKQFLLKLLDDVLVTDSFVAVISLVSDCSLQEVLVEYVETLLINDLNARVAMKLIASLTSLPVELAERIMEHLIPRLEGGEDLLTLCTQLFQVFVSSANIARITFAILKRDRHLVTSRIFALVCMLSLCNTPRLRSSAIAELKHSIVKLWRHGDKLKESAWIRNAVGRCDIEALKTNFDTLIDAISREQKWNALVGQSLQDIAFLLITDKGKADLKITSGRVEVNAGVHSMGKRLLVTVAGTQPNKKFCNFLKKKSELDGGELLGRFSSNWFTASAQVDNAHLHTLRMFSLIFDLMNGNALRAASLIWLHSTLISQLRSFDDSALSCTCASISDRFLTGGVISKRWIDVAAEVMKRLVDIGNPCFVIAGKQLDGCEYRKQFLLKLLDDVLVTDSFVAVISLVSDCSLQEVLVEYVETLLINDLNARVAMKLIASLTSLPVELAERIMEHLIPRLEGGEDLLTLCTQLFQVFVSSANIARITFAILKRDRHLVTSRIFALVCMLSLCNTPRLRSSAIAELKHSIVKLWRHGDKLKESAWIRNAVGRCDIEALKTNFDTLIDAISREQKWNALVGQSLQDIAFLLITDKGKADLKITSGRKEAAEKITSLLRRRDELTEVLKEKMAKKKESKTNKTIAVAMCSLNPQLQTISSVISRFTEKPQSNEEEVNDECLALLRETAFPWAVTWAAKLGNDLRSYAPNASIVSLTAFARTNLLLYVGGESVDTAAAFHLWNHMCTEAVIAFSSALSLIVSKYGLRSQTAIVQFWHCVSGETASRDITLNGASMRLLRYILTDRLPKLLDAFKDFEERKMGADHSKQTLALLTCARVLISLVPNSVDKFQMASFKFLARLLQKHEIIAKLVRRWCRNKFVSFSWCKKKLARVGVITGLIIINQIMRQSIAALTTINAGVVTSLDLCGRLADLIELLLPLHVVYAILKEPICALLTSLYTTLNAIVKLLLVKQKSIDISEWNCVTQMASLARGHVLRIMESADENVGTLNPLDEPDMKQQRKYAKSLKDEALYVSYVRTRELYQANLLLLSSVLHDDRLDVQVRHNTIGVRDFRIDTEKLRQRLEEIGEREHDESGDDDEETPPQLKRRRAQFVAAKS
ncbi:hypothetical protein Tcan_07797 [Toxocara canis]|uniref:FANCI_HD2 domain-containing protein n=1 Tax=Toxocara canis TaxID=6265 RepID=A0A0B2VYX8_TOXCA|nr:hypothetical protein Tcan_07797 [Toxocara canis]